MKMPKFLHNKNGSDYTDKVVWTMTITHLFCSKKAKIKNAFLSKHFTAAANMSLNFSPYLT